MAAGKRGEVNLNDLGLKNSYSLSIAALATQTYNDLMIDVLIVSFCFMHPPFSRNFCETSGTNIRTHVPGPHSHTHLLIS